MSEEYGQIEPYKWMGEFGKDILAKGYGPVVKVTNYVLMKKLSFSPFSRSCLIYDGNHFVELEMEYFTIEDELTDGSIQYFLPETFHALTLNNGMIYPIDYWDDCFDNYVFHINLDNLKDRKEKDCGIEYSCEIFERNNKLYCIIYTYKVIPSVGNIPVKRNGAFSKEIPGILLYY